MTYEEGNESLDMSESKPQIIAGISDEKENTENNLISKEENTTEIASEVGELPDPVQSLSKPGQLERELSEIQHFASMKESDLGTSEERTDSHQKATQSKTSRPKRNKFKRLTITEETFKLSDERNGADKVKEDPNNLDPRAIDLSAEQVSSNVAPPSAHLTVDAVGSPNGFTEAYEEVLKLASEANKTAGEKSAQLQEESSMTELLSTEKPANLSVQAVEVIDVVDQKLSTEKNESSVNKDTMASVGLASEEHEHSVSVGGDSDALREATHNTQSDSNLSRKEDSVTEIPILDPHGENDKSQNDNPLHTKENIPTEESETIAASTVSDAVTTVADVKAISSDLHQDVGGNSNESMIVTSGQILGSDSEARSVDNGGKADHSLEISNSLDGELTVNVTGTINNFIPVKDGDNVTDIKKPDDGIVRDQLLQVEVQQENQPQESGIISSLKSRAASGSLQVGMLNMGALDLQYWQFLAVEEPMIIPFERVKESVEWNHLYPEWVDEEQKYGTPNCPSVPMPMVSPEVRLDVVIAYAPCTPSSVLQDGWKKPISLQVFVDTLTSIVCKIFFMCLKCCLYQVEWRLWY